MWKQFTSEGFMQYPNFLETVLQLIPMYRLRAIGGSLYIIGALLMCYNLWKTAKSGRFVPEQEVQAAPLASQPKVEEHQRAWGHRWLEAKPLTFTVLAFVAVVIGGLIEIIPMYLIKENVPTIASVKPYSSLEVLGRDIYIREGCVGCHSPRSHKPGAGGAAPHPPRPLPWHPVSQPRPHGRERQPRLTLSA